MTAQIINDALARLEGIEAVTELMVQGIASGTNNKYIMSAALAIGREADAIQDLLCEIALPKSDEPEGGES